MIFIPRKLCTSQSWICLQPELQLNAHNATTTLDMLPFTPDVNFWIAHTRTRQIAEIAQAHATSVPGIPIEVLSQNVRITTTHFWSNLVYTPYNVNVVHQHNCHKDSNQDRHACRKPWAGTRGRIYYYVCKCHMMLVYSRGINGQSHGSYLKGHV